MRKPKYDLHDLLIKYASGNNTNRELEVLHRLLRDKSKESEIKAALDKDWHFIFHRDSLEELELPESFFEQILQKAKADKRRSKPRRRTWLRVAAAFVGLLALGGLLYETTYFQKDTASIMVVQTGIGEQKTITLPDGSTAYLNVASQLRYPESFSEDLREVYLEGEAFFEVVKNPNMAFVVHSGGFKTEVLGTSFNVSAYSEEVRVAVATGKVRVGADTAHAVLRPGQQATWSHNADVIATGSVAAHEVAAWREGRLVFAKTPLQEVLNTLERWYDVQLEVADKQMAACPVRVTLQGETLQEVLETLAFVLDAEFEYVNSAHIRLLDGSCITPNQMIYERE